MIGSYEEALFLHSTTEAQRRELETALQVAQEGVQQAMQKLQLTRKRLTKAEFQAGRARNMIKKSRFSGILQQKAHRKRQQPVIALDGKLSLIPHLEFFITNTP